MKTTSVKTGLGSHYPDKIKGVMFVKAASNVGQDIIESEIKKTLRLERLQPTK